jgi:hypothetical protein
MEADFHILLFSVEGTPHFLFLSRASAENRVQQGSKEARKQGSKEKG